MSSEDKTVVVLGATGAIGRNLLRCLAKEESSWIVKAVTRDPLKAETIPECKLPTVQIIQGDPLDYKESLEGICKTADIIFQCILHLERPQGASKFGNYAAEKWPELLENVLKITREHYRKKKVVFLDNLYAYEVTPERTKIVLDSGSPQKRVPPGTGSHAAIRSMLMERIQTHMALYPGTVAVVSTSDYFGPHAVENVFLGKTFTKRICQGSSPFAVGSASVVHDFCFLPDLAQALRVASKSVQAYDKFWICPHSLKGKTLNEIGGAMDFIVREENIDDDGEDHGSFAGVTVMPALMVRTLRPFNAYIREIMDRVHCWKQDFEVDDTAFCETFHLKATPYEDALKKYVFMYLRLIENQQQHSLE